MDEPVIKKEHAGHYYTPTPPATRDCSSKVAYSNEAHLFRPSRPHQQPIYIHVAAQTPRRLGQADMAMSERQTSGDSSPNFSTCSLAEDM
jgi:hypothetical protein